MNDFCCMSPEELTVLATAVAVELARGKSADEILVLRNLMSQISQSLLTISGQKVFLSKNCRPDAPTDNTPHKT